MIGHDGVLSSPTAARPAGVIVETLMSQDRNPSVQERAYRIWQREGRPHGRHLTHWLQAEAEIDVEAAPPVVVEVIEGPLEPAKDDLPIVASDVDLTKSPPSRPRKPRAKPS
jgi:hypothetical protein